MAQERWTWVWASMLCTALPEAATAAPIDVAFSFGQSLQLHPKPVVKAHGSALRVAPSYRLQKNLRLELGVVALVDGARQGRFDLELRPMIVLEPPRLPFYGRLTAGFVRVLSSPRVAFGAAIGSAVTLDGTRFFAEIGTLPRQGRSPLGNERLLWLIEGWVGASVPF